jgi:hypothetical protein
MSSIAHFGLQGERMLAPRSTRSLLLCLTLLLAVLALPGSASAANCGKRGLKVVYKENGNFVLVRELKGRDARGYEYIVAKYACSSQFGRRVFLGYEGSSADGGFWEDRITFNDEFVAWVSGHGDNGDGEIDDKVNLANLYTRKKKQFQPASTGDADSGVSALALNERGSIGWIARDVETEVRLRTSGKPRKVASGPAIDPEFLRFDQSGAGHGLVWSTTTGSAK